MYLAAKPKYLTESGVLGQTSITVSPRRQPIRRLELAVTTATADITGVLRRRCSPLVGCL